MRKIFLLLFLFLVLPRIVRANDTAVRCGDLLFDCCYSTEERSYFCNEGLICTHIRSPWGDIVRSLCFSYKEPSPTLTPVPTLTPSPTLTPIPTEITCPACKSKGDYNCDGKVNGLDYSWWKQEFIDKVQHGGKWEASSDCTVVSLDDYSVWRDNYLK
jgi:hypothetical protein